MNTMHHTLACKSNAVFGVCAALLLAAGASTSLAQSAPAGESGGGFSGSYSQPLSKKARAAQNNTTMMVSESDGSDTYTLKIAGDDVSAEVNGKKVPQDRIRRKGDTVEILGKDGEVVHTFQIAGMQTGGAKVGAWAGTPRQGQPPVPPEPPAPPAMDEPEMAPPPVMLGLLMNDNPDADGIEVADVFPGMPAAKAGLAKGDVIVKLDGKPVEDAMDLREVIANKKGGDNLEVVVDRDGEKKTLTVELIGYDPEAMAKARAKATGEPQTKEWRVPGFSGTMRTEDDWSAHAKKAIEKALADLNSKEGLNSEKWKAEIQKALEQALAGVEKASGEMRLKVQEWGGSDTPGAKVWGGDAEGGPARVFVMPRGGGGPGGGFGGGQAARGADTNEKLDRLAEQLERLNKRLADMEKKLAEHKQP